MSGFSVESSVLVDAAVTVAGVCPGVEELRARVDRHGAAARGTRAAVGMSDLADHWAAVLPHFSGASGSLAEMLHGAAVAYRVVDGRVVDAAAGV